MKFLITKCLYGKSFLNYYNFANYSYRFCYIWSSCDFLGLSNHTQVIAIQANQVKSPSYIVQVKSQRALKSPNHWKWWLSSDSNHKSLESLWLGTNSVNGTAAYCDWQREKILFSSRNMSVPCCSFIPIGLIIIFATMKQEVLKLHSIIQWIQCVPYRCSWLFWLCKCYMSCRCQKPPTYDFTVSIHGHVTMRYNAHFWPYKDEIGISCYRI